MARKHDVRRGDGFIVERVTSTGETRYQARWKDGSKWKSKTFGEVEEAEDHLRSVRRRKHAGTYEPESRLTVAVLVDEYLTRGRGRGKKPLSPNSIANYRTIQKNIIDPAIGHRIAATLRPRDMRLFMDRLESEYSPSRVVVIRAVLSGAFSEAMELGILDRNPLSGVRVQQPEPTELTIWTQEDVEKLFRYIADKPKLNAWYLLALTTGMRPGEMRALAWENIDFDNQTVLVSDTVSRDENYRPYIKKSTKTGGKRLVDIPESTVKALRVWRPIVLAQQLSAELWFDLGLVFPRDDGKEIPQQTQARHHRDTLLAAGVPYLKPHGMRHTVVTVLLEGGMNEKLVGEIVGHTRPRTTRLYNQPTRNAKKAAAKYLESQVRMGESAGELMGEMGEFVGESDEGETDAM